MKLKNTVYKTIEVAEDEDCGMVIGNIVMDDSKLLYAEIVDSTICDHEELNNIRAFLDEVEDMMTTNTSNMANAETEPIINEGCVGICKVVDVAANLQKELDSAMVKLVDSRNHCGCLSNIIENLKDSNIDDLKELYDIYEEELFAVKCVRKTAMALSSEIIDNLEVELSEKQEIIDKIALLRSNEIETLYGLEAELSVCKYDSDVLMKVVKIVKQLTDGDDDHTNSQLMKVYDIIEDYLNTPEGPPEHHIDWEQGSVAAGNTSYTVEMDIRCE